MKFKRKIALLLFLHTVIFTVSYGQNTLFLPLTKLETKDGLSSPNVRKIVKDKYGFMWFATQDGLNRFDGTKFTQFTSASPEQKQRILGTDVFDIAIEEDSNSLWCLTAYGGLSKIDINTARVVFTHLITTHPTNRSKLWFKCMSLKKNSIYIGTDEGIAIQFNIDKRIAERSYRLNYTPGLPSPIDKIYCDNYGHVWLMISYHGIKIMDDQLRKQTGGFSYKDFNVADSSGFRFTDITGIDENLLICTNKGLLEINAKNPSNITSTLNTRHQIPAAISNSSLFCISASGRHILLSGELGLHAVEKKTGKTNRIQFSKNLDDRSWLAFPSNIFLSGETVWIGSPYGVGWIKNITTPFTGFFNSMSGNGIKIDHSVTLCDFNDSTITVCADNGLYFANHVNGSINKFAIQDFYYHAFKGPDDYIIASGLEKGIQVADRDGKESTLLSVFPELAILKHDLLMSSENLDDSLYFLASQNQKGIYIWNYRKKIVRILNTESTPVALKSTIINRVFLDSKKRLWIVGDNIVSLYDHYNNTIRHIDLVHEKAQPGINMDVCEAGGRYWLASYGTGVVGLNENMEVEKVYSQADGINNVGIYKIFTINDSLLIASSNNGLFTININSKRVINYFEEAGLHSNNFEEASGFSSDKYIFLGGLRGFTKIDRNRLVVQKGIIGLYLSSIRIYQPTKITDTFNLALKKLELPSNLSQIVVNVANLNYENPEKIIFEFRRKENEEWIALGKDQSIPIPRFGAGTYTLQVRAANEDGAWSEPIELKLIFKPKWNETWLFKAAIILLIIAAIYGLYKYRINQLRKEEHIRRRLASDLHDDLGSTLNSIKVYTNLATMQKDNPDHLLKIKESTQDAIVGIRDIIWVLDDKKDTVEHLLNRVNQFASPLCHVKGTRFVQVIDEIVHDYQLAKEEKRNLYMILKESVNNSIKYADCSEISLKIVIEGRKLKFTISDNGKGFDTQAASEGNGIKNMKTRAGEIGYKIHIDSSTEGGTKITLERK